MTGSVSLLFVCPKYLRSRFKESFVKGVPLSEVQQWQSISKRWILHILASISNMQILYIPADVSQTPFEREGEDKSL